MEISAALATDLAILTEALDDPTIDLAQTLRDVAGAAGAAVASYVGLSVEIEIDGRVVTLSAFEGSAGPSNVRTSLNTPLPLDAGRAQADTASPAGIALVLYASTPGAFVDLAADLSWLTTGVPPKRDRSLGSGTVELDRHLSPAEAAERGTSISDLTIVNQAIGVLIGRGETPEQAERELYLNAARDNVDVATAASIVLAQIGDIEFDAAPEV